MPTGLVTGRFMPPHRGHEHLVAFARAFCGGGPVLVVRVRPDDPIPGDLRLAWMRESFPDCRVLALDEPDLPGAWPGLLRGALRTAGIPSGRPDILFAGDAEDQVLARGLGARFLPVDPARGQVPVSSAACRADPAGMWADILPAARPYFLKRVCIFGPESCGKTTLAHDLARRYGTAWVPEYTRTYLDVFGPVPTYEMLPVIARGHAASLAAAERRAVRVLFSDTDALTTRMWSDLVFGRVAPEVEAEVAVQRWDLTLLTADDVPFVPDPQRTGGNRREVDLDHCRRVLEAHGRDHLILRGDWEARMAAAVGAVDRLLGGTPR
ncbi:MAG TPA: AAA family ATPase [Azospirillaceae bacterium]|nr:AAA family ATPase [Azospirillaceae bacterium]